MAQEFKLTQTKSGFKFAGIVEGMNDNSYNEGTIQQGKNEGKSYRSVRFRVRTNTNNALSVELFGMEQDYVYPYKQGKKGENGKRAKGETKKIPFEDRNDLPEGYHLIGVSVSLQKEVDAKGKEKVIRENLVDYDAVDAIYNNLSDGDSIYVAGEVQISEYEDRNGEVQKQAKYIIKSINLQKKPIDFNAEDFEELNAFEQEIVFVGADVDKASETVIVTGRTIQYGDKFTDYQFYIRPNGKDSLKKLGAAFAKKVQFGDLVKVLGLALNKSEEVEVKVKADKAKATKDDPFADAGEAPKGYDKTTVTNYTQELQITAIAKDDNGNSVFVKGKYKEEDFVVEELIDEDEDDDKDPFASEDDDDAGMQDISDDDLPF
jgi:single-stranded DNA-binding protein